jgi:serine/threonine-protein kinase
MATVYLARDLKHDRDVALKVLRPELAAALGTDRFLREIRIASQLSHPHIIPLFDSVEADGRLLYVMPFMAGESLRDRLDREPKVPVPEAVEIARQIARALEYAHGQGVVHRDIKPENILLQAGHAVVADFGIARAIDAAATGSGSSRLTETGFMIGTPRYMSPEQILGGPVTGASDVYSLGCVLYEMLAGAPPFDGPTPQAVIARHTSEQASSLRRQRAEVSRSLEQMILRAMAKAPEDRFAGAGEFERALGGEPVPRRRAIGTPSTRFVWSTTLAVLGLAGWWVWTRDRPAGGATGADSAQQGLAVMYFDNLSRDSSDVYLAEGITEELITRLGQIDRLAVPSRTAVRRFRGRPIDNAAEMARELEVSHLLTGSVQRSGSRLRVRIELLQARRGDRLLNRSFDQTDGDVLAVTDRVARDVAQEVVGQLVPEELSALAWRPSQSQEAYDHYLRGNFYLTRRTSEADGRRALEEYQAALRIDPNFAAALGRMGLVYGIYASFPWVEPGPAMDSLVQVGLAAANRAIELDSTSADGWLARGFLLIPAFDDPDSWRAFAVAPLLMSSGSVCRMAVPDCRQEAVQALTRAVRLDPRNGEVWYQFGRAQLGTASGDSAMLRALALAPDLAQAAWLSGLRSLRSGRPDQAIRLLDSAIVLGRRDINVHGLRTEARIALGDLAGARADLDTVARLVSDSVSEVYHGYLKVALAQRQGDTTQARRLATALVRRHSPGPGTRRSIRLGLAATLVTVGRKDQALHLLETAIRSGGFVRSLPSSVWDPIRSDPRFQRLLAAETAR